MFTFLDNCSNLFLDSSNQDPSPGGAKKDGSDHVSTLEEGQASADPSSSEIIVIRNVQAHAPNMSLNCRKQSGQRELRAIAVFGTILQLGVLLYSGLATYHPRLAFTKDGKPIADYAFPCTAVGTVILVLGMLICSHVVESSTHEDRYKPCNGRKARIVWLQQTTVVNDQTFDSYAIHKKDNHSIIITSRPANEADKSTKSWDNPNQTTMSSRANRVDKPTRSSDNPNQTISGTNGKPVLKQVVRCINNNELPAKAISGSFIGLIGFVVQFSGLRGMHWSATIAQLLAVFIMTCLRAVVRRGLANPPECYRLTPGFELQCFATWLGSRGGAHWPISPQQENREVKYWSIVLGGDQAGIKPGEPNKDNSDWSEAYNIMITTTNLSKLAGWHGVSSAEAVMVARSIEIALDALLPYRASTPATFTWSLNARYGRSDNQKIFFRIQRHKKNWKAYADEINACLSLWLHSIRAQEDGEKQQPHDLHTSPKPLQETDDAWLRSNGIKIDHSLRLLGQCSQTLARDLAWWIPPGVGQILELYETDGSGHQIRNDRIFGFGKVAANARANVSGRTKYSYQEIRRSSFNLEGRVAEMPKSRDKILATKSDAPLEVSLAQDIFAGFMQALARTMRRPIEGDPHIRPGKPNEEIACEAFTLQNSTLLKLAQDIQNTGLGRPEDVYLSLIPPLSAEGKLRSADDAPIDPFRQYAKPYEESQDFGHATKVYICLIGQVKTFPQNSLMYIRGTAVVMEYCRTLTLTFATKRHMEDMEWKTICDHVKAIEHELRSISREVLIRLMGLFEEQSRGWSCAPVQETRRRGVEVGMNPGILGLSGMHKKIISGDDNISKMSPMETNLSDIFGWKPWHYAIARRNDGILIELLDGTWLQSSVNVPDLAEWTALHYSCQRTSIATVRQLLKMGANVFTRGRDGATPLHCAAENGCCRMVQGLIDAGASLSAVDASQNTPLHIAAMNGHADVVRLLLKLGGVVEHRNRSKLTPLHLGVLYEKTSVVELLLKRGAEKDAWTADGYTPIHLAVIRGNIRVITLLYESGVNMEAKNHGLTPLELAADGPVREHIRNLLAQSAADKKASS